jgi:hypothetical protein
MKSDHFSTGTREWYHSMKMTQRNDCNRELVTECARHVQPLGCNAGVGTKIPPWKGLYALPGAGESSLTVITSGQTQGRLT